jgi:pyruvate formate lyase activating enzyme
MDKKVATRVAQVSPREMAKSKKFARYIQDSYPNIQITLCWVLLKDLTDTNSELDVLAAFGLKLGSVFNAIKLIPYHEVGHNKYSAMNMAYPLDDMCAYCLEDAVKVQERLEKAGLLTVLSNV